MDFALEMVGISKRFPGTLAVDNVDFRVQPGEVHALLGENGAGKSTLVKVLAGAFGDYTGEIRVHGKVTKLHSPAAAKQHGIELIHQELNLSLPQTIAENLLAGRLPTRFGFVVNKKAMLAESRRMLARVGLELDPVTPVDSLSQHEAQLVEIAKALGCNPKIIVMDEPTSALTRDDVEILFAIIRRLRDEGLAVVYISHHLPEVYQVADRATVLRDGKLVGVCELCDTRPEELVRLMVGNELTERTELDAMHSGPGVLGAEGLTRDGFFRDVSFTLHEGEVVGLCGLAGAGRSELARSVCGIDPLHHGRLSLRGKPLTIKCYQDALKNRIAYLTEDRKQQGLALRLDVGENAVSALTPRLGKGPFYSESSGKAVLTSLLDELRVSPPNPRQVVRNLSGGNQQKVLLAKWLAVNPDVIILDEPTRGVDVGAKAIIHDAIRKLATEGKAVLLISSDLPELLLLSDRVLIMHKGQITGEVPKHKATEESVLLAANGPVGGRE